LQRASIATAQLDAEFLKVIITVSTGVASDFWPDLQSSVLFIRLRSCQVPTVCQIEREINQP
jgi:hypothetical protein